MNDFALSLWLGSGIFLMATELLLPGLVMVFVGMGALTVAISMYFGYVDSYVHQLMIFFISSSIYLSTLRFLVLRFVPTDTRNENINEDDKVIGSIVEVVADIKSGEFGRIEQGGSSWQALAEEDLSLIHI